MMIEGRKQLTLPGIINQETGALSWLLKLLLVALAVAGIAALLLATLLLGPAAARISASTSVKAPASPSAPCKLSPSSPF